MTAVIDSEDKYEDDDADVGVEEERRCIAKEKHLPAQKDHYAQSNSHHTTTNNKNDSNYTLKIQTADSTQGHRPQNPNESTYTM
jgi:hypothetical protein